MHIYLDTNVWCRAFDKPSQRTVRETNAFFKILESTYEGKFAIVGSIVLDVEAGAIENQEKREVVKKLMALFASEKVFDISISKSKEIGETIKLKLPDATHLACAVIGGCKYFISCDDEILKKSKEIEKHYGVKVCNPVEFVRERK